MDRLAEYNKYNNTNIIRQHQCSGESKPPTPSVVSTSTDFSSISQKLPSPFNLHMQRRLQAIRDQSSQADVLPVLSTPNVYFHRGVNHYPSRHADSQKMVTQPSKQEYRVITDTNRSVISVKSEQKDHSHTANVARMWSPNRVPSAGSHVSSDRKSTASSHIYYNLLPSSTLPTHRNVSLQVNMVPLPKRSNNNNSSQRSTTSVIPPLPPVPPIPYQRIENRRQSTNEASFTPIHPPPHSSTSLLHTNSHNQTAILPVPPQLPVLPHHSNHSRSHHSQGLPIIPEQPEFSYAKFLERKYGFKPESAAALIPAFQTPCCLWAEKVRRVLQARGFYDLEDPWLAFALLPFVLGKLPSSIAQMAPTNSLAYLLDFIESYDRRTNSLHDVLTKTVTTNVKPSAAFLQRCTELRRARGPDLDDDAVRQLAWQSLSTNLPSQLQSFVLTIRASNELPTSRQWEIIDNLWFDSLSKQELNTKLAVQTVANNDNDVKPKIKNPRKNINQLSSKVD